MPSTTVLIAVPSLLICGALNTLTTKIQFTMTSVGTSGEEKLFQKPWFGTFSMFVGMAFVLFAHFAAQERERRKGVRRSATGADVVLESEKAAPLLNAVAAAAVPAAPRGGLSPGWAFVYVGVPAAFDLVATGLCYIGLLFISASIWQMLRGSMIIFAALMSIPGLGRRLYGFHWLGIFICTVGIVLVGAANLLNASGAGAEGSDTSGAWAGMLFVTLGQVVQAAQVVAEEKLLKDVHLPSMQIVAYEGIWGIILMLAVVFPICQVLPGSDNGHAEDSLDTVMMLEGNGALCALICLYMLSCATSNVAGLTVSSSLTAVHRTMLEASRSAVIWLVDLAVFYLVSPDISFGEAWLPYSPLQLGGFLLLVFGQLVYSSTVKVPGLFYPPPESNMKVWQSPSAQLMSPMLPSPTQRVVHTSPAAAA